LRNWSTWRAPAKAESKLTEEAPGVITSPRNKRVAAVRRLRRTRVRRETGTTLIDGPFLLEEAASGGVEILEVFALASDEATARRCEEAGWNLWLVNADVMGALGSSVSPRGPVAVISIPESPVLEARDSVVLYDIADPGNAGTIIRTAGAFGFQVMATEATVDLWSPKVIRSAVGGHFRAHPILGIEPDPAVLIEAGLAPLAAAAGSTTTLHDAVRREGPVALLIGNEAHGLSKGVIDTPGVMIFSIPMPGGSESLNAAVAAGIAMYLRMTSR
jgi:TrmH family RNA methyltransferase